MTDSKKSEQPAQSGLKTAIEMVPLVLFGVTFAFYGLKAATGVLMIATVAAVIASWFLLGHVTPMLGTTAAIVLAFGTLTFVLDDKRFIKMKPTAVNVLFAAALGYGLATGRYFLKTLIGDSLKLTSAGWRQLTIRWMAFFLVLAVLNEVIWRTWNTDETEYVWVYFKLFGILGLTFAFMISQIGLLKRHALAPDLSPKSPSE